jgi:hypothetical protein
VFLRRGLNLSRPTAGAGWLPKSRSKLLPRNWIVAVAGVDAVVVEAARERLSLWLGPPPRLAPGREPVGMVGALPARWMAGNLLEGQPLKQVVKLLDLQDNER